MNISSNFRVRLPSPTYIVNAVYEGIVAGVAHREAITAEPDDVDVPVLVDGRPRDLQNVVQLQRKPRHAEEHHDNHQHLDDLLLVLEQIQVPRIFSDKFSLIIKFSARLHIARLTLCIARRFAAPELNGHLKGRTNFIRI